jgi:branched-chain amino acid transport system permease protein
MLGLGVEVRERLTAAPRPAGPDGGFVNAFVGSKALLLAAVAIVILAFFPYVGIHSFYISLLTQAYLLGIGAVSLDLLIGRTGLVSLCHASFFGLGAYATAMIGQRLGINNLLVVALVAAGVACAVSIVFGLIALRGRGAGFIIITLALNQITWGLAFQWVSFSGGENGITGFTPPVIGPIDFSDPVTLYLVSLAAVAACVAVLWKVSHSPFGLVLAGIKEQPRRMAALGYNVFRYQLAAFVIAAVVAAGGGFLFAYYNVFVSPVELSLATSVQFLIMVILGGSGTLIGPLIGSVIIVFLSNILSVYTDRWPLLLGIAYAAIVLFTPDGLLGMGERLTRGRLSISRAVVPRSLHATTRLQAGSR